MYQNIFFGVKIADRISVSSEFIHFASLDNLSHIFLEKNWQEKYGLLPTDPEGNNCLHIYRISEIKR